VAPSPGGALGTAGLSRGGERRTGLLLAREGHGGPLTRRCLGHRRPLPRWGEAYWNPACAGRTLRTGLLLAREGHQGAHPKKPGSLLSRPPHPDTGAPSPGGAFGVLECCLRRNDTSPGPAGLCRQGRGGLDSRLRGNDISPPQTANVPLPSGRGSIPLTWLSQRLSRPLPGWGEAGKKKPRDSPSA
jgi:hypothetical protein